MRLSLALLFLLPACDNQTAAETSLPAWSTPAEPSLAIGGAEGTGPAELNRVTSSVRLDDGTIVLANAGSHELRWFDSTGAFIRTTGRQGKGPGEYTGLLFLAAAGDSVTILDGGNRRFTRVNREDGGVRTAPLLPGDVTEFPGNVLLYRRTWVTFAPASVSGAEIRRALDGLAGDVPAGHVREGRWTAAGTFWIRNPGDSVWTVHAGDHPVATVSLPAGFEVQSIGRDWVLGRERDEDDVERIVLYPLLGVDTTDGPGSVTAPTAYDPVAEAAAHPDLVQAVTQDLRSMLMAQEMYFANNGAYASTADSLDLSPSSGATLGIYSHSGYSWVAVATHPDFRLTCAMGVGALTPAGWEEGEVKCG